MTFSEIMTLGWRWPVVVWCNCRGWVLVHEIRNKCNNHQPSGSALDPTFRWYDCKAPTECLTFRFHCYSCVERCSPGDVLTVTEESGGGGLWQHVMSRGSKWFNSKSKKFLNLKESNLKCHSYHIGHPTHNWWLLQQAFFSSSSK